MPPPPGRGRARSGRRWWYSRRSGLCVGTGAGVGTQEGRVFREDDAYERGGSRGSTALALIGFVGLCLLVAVADGAVTATSVGTWYLSLHRPPAVPPNWVFGPVWTVLYVMMGTAAWMVWRRPANGRALRLWGWQLALNAIWTPAYFGLRSPPLGLAVILALLVMIVLTIRAFAGIDRRAAWLMVPYLAWTGFATYLNAGFWWLN